MMQKKSDDAVSPVIGVMLMLVITVVVAGVIAAFGTGMVGETESAPNVVLDVKILSNTLSLEIDPATGEPMPGTSGKLSGPDFQIRHVSGDPLDTDEIEIQMAWTASDGEHYSTYSAAEFKENNPSGVASQQGALRSQPMYMKVENVPTGIYYTYSSDGMNYYFGDVVLTPGMRLTASTDWLPTGGEGNNLGSDFMNAIFDKDGVYENFNSLTDPGIMKYLLPGTPVEITILHLPSNTVIYEKEVIVQ